MLLTQSVRSITQTGKRRVNADEEHADGPPVVPLGSGAPGRSSAVSRNRGRVEHELTRYRATVTSFGWPVKVLIGCPPWVTLAWWAWLGVFGHPIFMLIFAVPLTWAAVWWTAQVWGRHRSDLPVQRSRTAVYGEAAPAAWKPHLTLGAASTPPLSDSACNPRSDPPAIAPHGRLSQTPDQVAAVRRPRN